MLDRDFSDSKVLYLERLTVSLHEKNDVLD